MRAQFVFQEIWIGLRRNMTMTIALVVTVAIAMALFGVGVLLKMQVDRSNSYWSNRADVSVYLCNEVSSVPNCNHKNASDAQIAAIKAQIQRIPQVVPGGVTFVSQQQAFGDAKNEFASTPGFSSDIQIGDIPASFQVKLKDSNDDSIVVAQMQNVPGVDTVVNERQILDRFFKILSGLQWAALIIAAIQVVAAVLLVGNTIRLSAFNRRKETGIMRLVGASNIYIQLPFILEGAIAGLLGGALSAVLLVAAKSVLLQRLESSLQFASGLGWTDVGEVIVVAMCGGVLICAVASFLTLRRYLRI